MDRVTLQAKIDKGNGFAAKRLGDPFDVYRAPSLLDPLALANKVGQVMAAMTPDLKFGRFDKPNSPYLTLLGDASTLEIGDWLTDGESTFYVADKQRLLPVPVVQCRDVVSIERAGGGTAVGGGYSPDAGLVEIARSLPVFMNSKKDKAGASAWFPVPSASSVAQPTWQFFINARGIGDIKANDVIVDAQGLRYQIDMPVRTSFGFIVEAKLEQP